MSILETAKNLGEMIRSSEEYQRFTKAQEDIQANEGAIKLLQEFDEIRHEYSTVVSSNDSEKVTEVTEKIKSKEQELRGNQVANEFIEASASYSNVIKSVNDTITSSIAGKQEEQGCDTGSCGSCGCGC
jgi:cell fate (sporulation/competence/biofilm development) regulator YlbF (YheA/YmcA/DUF963 family)